MRGRQKNNANSGKPQLPPSPPKAVKIDYKNTPKLCVHYQNGIDEAKRGFRPSWYGEEAIEWKCIERDAYRAGYRTIKPEE